jgi:membrane protease subunit HflK
MVTGDLNSALVEWIVQYRITDPEKYLFGVRNPGQTLTDLWETVMREVVGDRTVDEIITIGRQEIEETALERTRELAERYRLCVSINQVQLKNVNPHIPVQPLLNEVNRAQQDRENVINLANGDYNKAVPRARGEADQKFVPLKVIGLNGLTKRKAMSLPSTTPRADGFSSKCRSA